MKKIPHFQAVVKEIKPLTPTAIELIVARAGGEVFPDFLPGQYATLCFPTHSRLLGERSFSIASAPTDRSTLSFGVRLGGRYTSALRAVRAGDLAMVAGPYGSFTFDPNRDASVIFLAGGIGITPFLSMVRTATELQLTNKFTLLYSVRSLADAPYLAELSELVSINPRFRVLCAVTDGAIKTSAMHMVGGRISRDHLASVIEGDLWGNSYFLCGPPPFMSAMTANLKSLGLPEVAIRTERFGIGSSAFFERKTAMPWLILAGWGITAMLVFSVIVRMEQHNRSVPTTIQSSIPQVPASTNGSSNVSPSVTSSTSTTVTPQPSRPSSPAPIVPRTTVS